MFLTKKANQNFKWFVLRIYMLFFRKKQGVTTDSSEKIKVSTTVVL